MIMFLQIVPKLPFIIKNEMLDFYPKLGFEMLSDYGDYVVMKKENLEIHFFHFETLIKEKSDFMIYLRVSEIEKLYEELQQKSIEIHPNGKLEIKPWKQKEFSIIDPAGTLLTFGESM